MECCTLSPVDTHANKFCEASLVGILNYAYYINGVIRPGIFAYTGLLEITIKRLPQLFCV